MKTLDYPMFEGIVVTDASGKMIFWNESALEMMGFECHEVKGAYCHEDILNPVDLEGRQVCLMENPISEGVDWVERFLYLQHKKGHRVLVKSRVFPWVEDGVLKGVIETFIKTRGAYQEKTLPSNLIEPITGLANKAYGKAFLEQSLALERNMSVPFGLLILDIDNFEAINLTYGRPVGDLVLETVALSLKEVFYDADLLIRWRGDEFMLIYQNVTSNGLKALGEQLRIVMENTTLRGKLFKDVDLTVSVGGTMVRPRDTGETMIERALGSLKRSKAKGGNRFAIS